jgi:Sugar transferases involved in lipopolysaccharide synthesis
LENFLRDHHLDEFPQLWNVFKGDMSFVGPRPERQFFIDQIMEYNQEYERLYAIRPGLFSKATLYNGYTDTMEKMLERLKYDLEYLDNQSFFLDIKIIALTSYSILTGKKI